MPMSESTLQMMLARDPAFLNRLNYIMLQTARGVKEEDPTTPHHAKRTTYASNILGNSQMMVGQAAYTVVGGVNLIGTVDLTDNGVETSANDAAIFSQVSTFWNALAGVDSADEVQSGTEARDNN
jgi:hypothetical protein